MEVRGQYNQTSDLWKVSEQPVTALKDSFSIFLSYLEAAPTDDRVGLVIYTAANSKAIVEHSLTTEFDEVSDTVQHRQAGHYDPYTNIGDGIRYGRDDLEDFGRVGAFKKIVLMTDGLANRPTGVNAAQYTRDQPNSVPTRASRLSRSACASADVNLMQDVADMTGGVHFNIPGGQTGQDTRRSWRRYSAKCR